MLHGRVTISSDAVDVQEATQTMQRLQLEVVSSNPLYEQTRKGISSAADLTSWFNIEGNKEVQMALIDNSVAYAECAVDE